MTARLILAALCLFFAGPVWAHSPVAGIDGLYTGLRHPFTTPDQILTLLATGLFLGSFGISRLTHAFAVMGLGLLGGITLGHWGSISMAWIYGFAALTAACAALIPGRFSALAVAVAGFAGLFLGWASVPEAGALQDRVITIAGSGVSIILVIFNMTGALDMLEERFDAHWIKIALRVAAAWVAAIAIVMLALGLALTAG